MNNLAKRSLSGLLFVIVMVGGMVLGSHSYAILFTFITFMALGEFHELVNEHQLASVNHTIGGIAGAYLFLSTFLFLSGHAGARIFLPYILSLILITVSELYLKRPNPTCNWAFLYAGQLYIALPFSLLSLLAFYGGKGYSGLLPLAVFIFIWLNDTGAYCFGSLLHRRFPAKLFERISPNKSWIGSIGGGITVLATAFLFHRLNPSVLSLPLWLGLGLTITLFSTWGDLVESLLKRQLGIKDSGRFLPGHGGILDRFDSALLAIPASVIFLYCFA